MNATYRHSRHEAWILWAGIPLALLLTCVFAVAARDAPHPLGVALLSLLPVLYFVGCICSPVFLNRHQLIVSDSQVEAQGLRAKRRVVFEDVQGARWQLYAQAGRLTLKTPNDRLAVNFNNYDRDAQRTLIRFFRFRLDQAIQRGWDTYWSHYWGLFDVQEPLHPVVQEKDICMRRRSVDLMFLVGTILAVETVAIVIWFTGRVAAIAVIPLFVVFWWFMRTRRSIIASQGKVAAMAVTSKSSYSRADIPLAAAAAVLFAVAAPAAVIFTMLDLPGRRVALLIAAYGPPILLSGPALWHTRRLRKEAARLARLAEEEYMVPLR
jgi:hypothetical protein